MKKTGILNRDLAEVVAGLGHYQEITICDAGFPIPAAVRRIDLALEPGSIPFLDAVRVVLGEMQVEYAVAAEELRTRSRAMQVGLTALLGSVELRFIPHDELKKRSCSSAAIVRTGEFTPYANVILVAGVVF